MVQGCIIFFVGLVVGVALIIIANILCEKRLRKRAFEKGWGLYDPETGQFKWVHVDAHYVFTGFSEEHEDVVDMIPSCKCKAEVYDINGNIVRSLKDTQQFHKKDFLPDPEGSEK